MPLNEKELADAIEKIKKDEQGKKKFSQSIDLVVNLKELDMKQAASRVSAELFLPHSLGKDIAVCVIASGDQALRASRAGAAKVIEKDELGSLSGDKKTAKKIAKAYDFFIISRELMPSVARFLGPALGPAGKMPLAPPKGNGIIDVQANVEDLIVKFKNSVRIKIKKNPVIMCTVGKENMETKQLAENVNTVYAFLEEHLEKGKGNIRNILIKKTMGKPIKVEV